jgi:hypothetical protein
MRAERFAAVAANSRDAPQLFNNNHTGRLKNQVSINYVLIRQLVWRSAPVQNKQD